MSDLYETESIYSNSKEVRVEHAILVGDLVLNKFSGEWPSVFDDLSANLPKTYKILSSHFTVPVLKILKYIKRESLVPVFHTESKTGAVNGMLYTAGAYKRNDIDDWLSMLPTKIRSYYKIVQGLQFIAPNRDPALIWYDLPLTRDATDELQDVSEDTEWSRKFIKTLPDYKNLRIWMNGSHGDFFVINSKTGDFYYAQKGDGSVFHLVDDPVDLWDTYCAYILRHGPKKRFDFETYFESLMCP